MSNPDFIHITTSGAEISRQFLADNIEEGGAHVDAIQLIPHDGYPSGVNRPWYAAAEIADVSVSDCSITSNGTLQGVTGFDGIFRNVEVNHCVFYLASQHKITFNGLLSGAFFSLYSGEFQKSTQASAPLHQDTKCIVRLNNLRIGGSPYHEGVIKQLHVLSFSDSRNAYRPVDFDGTVSIIDTRGLAVRTPNRSPDSTPHMVTNIANFDLAMYRKLVNNAQSRLAGLPVADVCAAYQRMAISCGDLVR